MHIASFTTGVAAVALCLLSTVTAAPARNSLTDAEIQQQRLQFLSQNYNTTANSAMIRNLDSAAIANVQKALAQKPSSFTGNGAAPNPASWSPTVTTVNGFSKNLLTDPYADAADATEISRYQLYAGAAYCFKWHLNYKWNCNERCTNDLTKGTTLVDHFYKDSTTGYVAYNDAQKTIIISFRGTLFPLNFFRDLQLYTEKLTIGVNGAGWGTAAPAAARVHSGFQTTYEVAQARVRSTVSSILAQPARSQYKIVVTGHSLGGAVAVLAALDLLDFVTPSLNNRIELYTYGEPRVGNSVFARWVDSLPIKIRRVTALHDLISTVPRREWGTLDYQHHNAEYYIDGDKKARNCVEPADGGEPSGCLNGEGWPIAKDVVSILTPAWIFWHLNSYGGAVFGPWC
ncbi:Alpha/Beta hydrolase protein [Fimicolochytrium jonesii]|uniref:Alpha/Beta hydrolase protein n=1 Tax=Fimicolochytrium jonesii TaxID=1396493 RepID=UPI0022FE17B0|nr:Alpha/Beta hydrolase protein [Fimicolochytrium jonesii]KAI8820094.1 Alpha/Beta hydrolase protein [Fimicolochytrium jonesii]